MKFKLDYLTLEELVQNYAHEKFDVFNLKTDGFTRKGRKQYDKMVDFLYHVADLTETDPDYIDRIVDKFEEIVRYY